MYEKYDRQKTKMYPLPASSDDLSFPTDVLAYGKK
jgi:hypothetical protein